MTVVDYVIRGGTILDGSGGEPYRADIVVSADRIGEIGDIPPAEAPELDATGLVVAPGFIDIHSHSDYTLLVDPRAVSAIHQGVTLEVIGNCGHGCFPVHNAELARNAIYGYDDAVPLTWNQAHEYFDALERAGPAVNVLSLVPNGQLRLDVVGLQQRRATRDELREMRATLAQSLEEGAWGFSSGLEYATEAGATEEELGLCARLSPGSMGSMPPIRGSATTVPPVRSRKPCGPRSAQAYVFRSLISFLEVVSRRVSGASRWSSGHRPEGSMSHSTCTRACSASRICRRYSLHGRSKAGHEPPAHSFATPTHGNA